MAQQAQTHAAIAFDRHVDLLVAGAGAGGMSAALVAAIEGMDVLLCESRSRWVVRHLLRPARCGCRVTLSRDAGFSDSKESAQLYLDALMGDTPQGALRRVFLDRCDEAIGFFMKNTDV